MQADSVERRRDASGEVIEQLGRMAIRAGAQASRLRVSATESIEVYEFVFCN